jgi:thiamine biosynthesis lipoprotein
MQSSVWRLALGAACATTIVARTDEPKLQRFEQTQMHLGTTIKVALYAADEATATMAASAAFARVVELDRVLSDYREDSELSLLCRRAGGPATTVSADLFRILERADYWRRESDGAFDVAAGPIVRLWRRARKTKRLPSEPQIAAARETSGGEHLKLDPKTRTVRMEKPGMQLDVGGVGKGFIGDEALAAMRRLGVARAMIVLGGDVVTGEPPPGKTGWSVEAAKLARDGVGKTMLSLAQRAASTSGDAYQYATIAGKRYSHIVDPRTGRALTERRQTTVVAPTGMDADALATAANVLGAEKAIALIDKHPAVAGLVLTIDADDVPRRRASARWSSVVAREAR